MRRFSRDEREEFESISSVHADALLRMARRLLRSDSLAEDAVQEILSGWRAFRQFQRDTNCKAWLFRILFNGIRKNGRAIPPVGLPPGRSLDNIFAIRTPFESLAYPDAIAAIDALPEEQRIVFRLAAVEGFACKQISSIFAIPIGTVMSRLSRCRAALRKALGHFEREVGTGKHELRKVHCLRPTDLSGESLILNALQTAIAPDPMRIRKNILTRIRRIFRDQHPDLRPAFAITAMVGSLSRASSTYPLEVVQA
jgi:RNA polymerase sigma-70 factor, ECF subfamily